MPRRLFSSAVNTLADYTGKSLLVPHCKGRTAEALLVELCSHIHEHAPLIGARTFYDAVMARETMSPTSFCPGWALPHARVQSLSGLCFAVGRVARPLTWFGESRPTVQIIFLFAVPEAEAKTYLNVISAVAKLSQSPALVHGLLKPTDALGMFEVLEKVALRQPFSPSIATIGAGPAPVKTLI
jgi:mannitol/fructose-specific phosphotransferase system IIA component (Ntr-type)